MYNIEQQRQQPASDNQQVTKSRKNLPSLFLKIEDGKK